MKATIQFTDVKSQKGYAVLTGLDPTDTGIMTKLKTAAGSIQAMVNAAITEIKLVRYDVTAVTGQTATANDYESVTHKGIVNFSYALNGENKNYRLIIPAPELARYEHVSGEGYRMTIVAGGALEAALRTATGISDLIFQGGYLEYWGGKPTMPEASYIKLMDTNRHMAYMTVSNVADKADVQTFAGVLRGGTPFTNAAVIEVGTAAIELETLTTATPAEEEGYDSAPEQRGRMVFSYKAGTAKKTMVLTVPTLMEDKFESVKINGRRKSIVKDAVGTLVAMTLSTVYGSATRALTFERGERDVVNR